MDKKKTGKKTRKSRAAKSVRDLPAKTLNAKSAKGVKGGWDLLLNKKSG